jgi:drug/metabolite transporter (DMT)-like permease
MGTGLYIVLLLVAGGFGAFDRFDARSLAFVGFNMAVGIVLGDTAYYSSMRLIGVSRALTISSIYPLITALLSGLLLHERFGYRTWVGFVLCIVGVILVARAGVRAGEPAGGDRVRRGTLLALAASLMWAMGTLALRIGSSGQDAVVVNSVRLGGVALVAGAWAGTRGEFRSLRRLGRRQWLPLALSALIGSFIGATLYIIGVQEAGAAKAAELASTAPLFSVPMSRLTGERITARLVAGMVVAVAGVMLVV